MQITKYFTTDDFKKLVEKYGAENLLIIAPLRPLQHTLFITYTSSSDDPQNIPCKIIETRYKLSENYKIQIQSIIDGYGKDEYYLMDFTQLVMNGQIKIYTKLF